MIIRVQKEDFDSVAVQRELLAGRSDVGALASFVGLVRDIADAPLTEMTLEHYPGMTEKALAAIAEQACERWRVLDLAAIHRIGALAPGDQIVLVMVASAHRGDAFAVCEFVMDYLKTEAPFWKKESGAAGTSWVQARDSDLEAQDKWKKR